MVEPCKPSADENGQQDGMDPSSIGLQRMPWATLYGKESGWCEADSRRQLDSKAHGCGCGAEDAEGAMCMGVKEAFCPAQCGGRGECDLGFCRCHSGWYGTDCSRKALAGNGTHLHAAARGASSSEESATDMAKQQPSLFALHPWLQPAAKKVDAIRKTRRRPFIYVYDLPPLYNSRMLQYKINAGSASHRLFGGNNHSFFNNNNYAIETYLHEAMLTSSHR